MTELLEPSRTGHVRRITTFDGLRGLAALVVLFGHALVASSGVLAAPYQSPLNRPTTGSVAWWLSETPLHIFWAGQEAVIVFFVLSGYVLAIPAVRRGTKWFDASYLPRRLIRIYLPVWGALVFASILHLAYSRRSVTGATFWLNAHPDALSAGAGVKTATLIHLSTASEFTTVLWSLQWEILFSVLLPLILLLPILTRRQPRLALLGALGCFALIGLGAQHGVAAARYMPIFVLGTLLAFHIDRLRVNVGRAQPMVTGIALALSVCLLTMSYWTQNRGSSSASGVPEIGVVLGACAALWLAANSPMTRRLFESRPGQWAGSRSFSLYLAHEPIVVTVGFILGGRPEIVEFLLIVIPLSLITAELFWRGVERPSVRFARWMGEQTFQLVRRLSGAPRVQEPA